MNVNHTFNSHIDFKCTPSDSASLHMTRSLFDVCGNHIMVIGIIKIRGRDKIPLPIIYIEELDCFLTFFDKGAR